MYFISFFSKPAFAEEVAQTPENWANIAVPHESQAMTPSLWDRDDWLIMNPKVALLEMQGYFRTRFSWLNRLDFDNAVAFETTNNGSPWVRFPTYHDNHATFNSANMRLRLQPIVHVTPYARFIMTWDIFDNAILGHTPDTLVPGMSAPPLDALSKSQKPILWGQNSLSHALQLKRIFLVFSALHEQVEIQLGRMPDHFGLGMLYNSGDGLDADYGMVADRLAVHFRLADHIFTPIIQWQGRRLLFRPFGFHEPQPFLSAGWADTMEYALRIRHEGHPTDIEQALGQGEQVWNYGFANAFRIQARDYPANVYNPTESNLGFDVQRPVPLQVPSERRDLFLYTGDGYAKYFWGPLELGLEAALQAGYFSDNAYNVSNGLGQAPVVYNDPIRKTKILAWGAAFEGRYQFTGEARNWQLGLKSGVASGDRHSGMGALNAADTQRSSNDLWLNNFQFSPDYHVDRLLYRTIIGTVTDSFYLSPQVNYRFDPRFLGTLAVLYGQALFAESTPSALTGSASRPLGLELDATLAFDPEKPSEHGQLYSLITASVLLPLSGSSRSQNAIERFAWSIQTRLAAAF